MAQLVLYSTPAQRARGQSFGDTFISSAKVALNGGTPSGTPTIDFGATLNGTTDSVEYKVSQELYSPKISFLVDFVPQYADDGNGRVIYSSTGNDYMIRKDTGDSLSIVLGNTTIANINKTVWLPHWRVGERNTIAVLGESADTDVILNKQKILSGDASAWSPVAVSEFTVGSFVGGASNFFKGTINRLEVYKDKLTDAEVADFHDNTIYNYRNQAIGDWPMQAAQHEATQTLDVSRSKKPAIFGGTITKQAKRGYEWGPANSYMLTAAGVIPAPITQCTAFVALRMSSHTANQAMFDFQKPDGTAVGCRISFTGATDEFFFHSGSIGANQAARLIVENPTSRLLIITGTHDGTDTRMCINGTFGTDAPTPLAPAATSESIVAIGARAGVAAPLRDGSIVYQSGLLDFALTPLQILDLEGKIKRSINAV